MKATSRRIIGIDPGSRRTGYGILDPLPGGKYRGIAWGVIKTTTDAPFPDRLLEIHEHLSRIIREHSPTEAVVEKVFLAKSVASALKLGHARGVVIVTCRVEGVPVFEYSAREIKSAATGYGAATKEQVASMISRLLAIHVPLSPDASDALAMAFCGATTNRFQEIG